MQIDRNLLEKLGDREIMLLKSMRNGAPVTAHNVVALKLFDLGLLEPAALSISDAGRNLIAELVPQSVSAEN